MSFRAWIAAAVIGFGMGATPTLGVTVGDPAPPLRADRWYNAPGPISLEDYRGQVVVVEFWATYCKPCHQVQPKLVQIHQKWAPRGVVLISMSDEPESIVAPFISKHPSPFIVSAGGDTPRRYGITGIPAAFVIDRTGTISWRGNPHEGMFEDAIERAVNGTAGGGRISPTAAPRVQSAEASSTIEVLDAPRPGFSSSRNTPGRPLPRAAAPAAKRPAPRAVSNKSKATRPVKKATPVKKKAGKSRSATATKKRSAAKSPKRAVKTKQSAAKAKPGGRTSKAVPTKSVKKKGPASKASARTVRKRK